MNELHLLESIKVEKIKIQTIPLLLMPIFVKLETSRQEKIADINLNLNLVLQRDWNRQNFVQVLMKNLHFPARKNNQHEKTLSGPD